MASIYHQHGGNGPCSECDLGALDDLKCEAEGIAKRAELMQQEAKNLDDRRKKYDEARKNYTKARGEDVGELMRNAERLLEQIKCQIDDQHTTRCLQRAHEAVQQRIEECGGTGGCCVDDDCDFDTEVPEGDPATVLPALYARQADVKRRTEHAEQCFDDLITEPAAIPGRIKALHDEFARISTELGGDAKKVDLKRLYAAALVANQAVKDVWHGFRDVNAYVDCLCRALMCSLKGRKALATLGAEIAVLECKEREKDARCQRLQQNTLEEVIAEYLRICPPTPDDDGCEPASSSAI